MKLVAPLQVTLEYICTYLSGTGSLGLNDSMIVIFQLSAYIRCHMTCSDAQITGNKHINI